MTTPYPLNELTSRLDILCRSHIVQVDDRDGRFLGTRNEQPLYAKLRAAVVSSGESGGGGGSEKRTSNPANLGAIDLMQTIRRRVASFYLDECSVIGQGDIRTNGMRVDVLTIKWIGAVSLRFHRGELDELGVINRARELQAIINGIRGLLDPDYSFELTSPCPECFEEFIGEGRRRVLRVTEAEPIEASFVTCAACNARWDGVHEARLLSIAIDARAAELEGATA